VAIKFFWPTQVTEFKRVAMQPARRRKPPNELFPGRCRFNNDDTLGERTMYRASDPQKPLFGPAGLLPPDKRELCEKSWAEPFRQKALPILREVEDEFGDLFDPGKGRPNRPVELVLGALILKEMKDLTDEEALEALEFDARWWWALDRELHELHLCQKTLHNFRQRLLEHEDADKKKLAFRRVTDKLIEALGVNTDRQRLDSKHLLSNFAVLTRLGLFCETIRVFLAELKKLDPKRYETLPGGILKRHGEESHYAYARRAEGPRRLAVVARDVGRLMGRFENDKAVSGLEGWKLLKRLFDEQCVVTSEPREPEKDDDDDTDGAVAAELKPAAEVSSNSLQTPHDPDATYSAHKGKGYEAHIAETCVAENAVELITEAEVRPSSQSDSQATVPTVETLAAAGHKPKEVVADTTYSGAKNAAALAKLGVNLLAPAPAVAKPKPGQEYPPPAPQCPEDPKEAGEWLRQQEASPEFRKRYAIRAGSEATNSELNRAHGMKKLRVRGDGRVKLAVYLKALACNVKRALGYWLGCTAKPEGAAVQA
jgi:hypothetical protein